MHRSISADGHPARSRAAVGRALTVALLAALAAGADGPPPGKPGGVGGLDPDALMSRVRGLAAQAAGWYERTPPADRVTWGGLAAASALGLGVLMERAVRTRARAILPEEFTNRFLSRLQDGRLDRGKALDFCELNPSPASRVALAAVRRWGRPTADLERAVGLAHRVEADRLRRHVGTLRRVAALTPLLGLLGTLMATGRALSAAGPVTELGPALAPALGPLTAGVALAVLALVAYDGLAGRVEQLVGALDRVGAETIDAIALSLPADPRPSAPAGPGPGPARTPHAQPHNPYPVRLEIPSPPPRHRDDEDDFD